MRAGEVPRDNHKMFNFPTFNRKHKRLYSKRMTYFLREIWGYMCVIELHFMVTYRRMYGKEKAEKEREKGKSCGEKK